MIRPIIQFPSLGGGGSGLPSDFTLLDSASGPSIDWDNRVLVNDAGITTLNWNARIQIDSSGNEAIAWGDRKLKDATEADVIDWSSYCNVKTTGAASQPNLGLTGTIFTGGTGTTTLPAFLLQPTGTTAASTWSTSGTMFGANAPTGFVGCFLDFKIAGGSTSAAKLTYDGAFSLSGANPAINVNYLTQNNVSLQSGGLFMCNDGMVVFASSASNNASGRDSGIARASARRLKVTNASTGFGDIQVRNLVPDTTLTTSMTDGFFNLPGAAGVPSGVPTVTTGYPTYVDETNLRLYVYIGGAWKFAALV